MLDKINNITDLKNLNLKEKELLAIDLRNYILDVVSKNGGHLASNLGVVELTIALLSIYDFSKDKIVWDVGHQVYSYKILTDRKDKFKTLRKFNGISGFPKINESIYDFYNTGHSGTSISAALGMARARDLKHENHKILAVIGDGALTGGIAIEALNDAGASHINMTVILNDNEMSIAKNIGGMNLFLSKLRTKKTYKKSNERIKKIINGIPLFGKKIIKITQKIKNGIKHMIIPKMFFEDIGFTYLGPVDGHNILELEMMLKRSNEINGPVIIHVLTKKGKGYQIAEDNPEKFHSTGSFDLNTGLSKTPKHADYSSVFGKKLVKLAKDNKKIVAITASMAGGTGLNEFKEKYPHRFFDVGIAEQHAIALAAGMATSGLIPVVPIYSSFYERAYDQVINDVCLQNLPVIMCVDRAGIVGADGETHQGIYDLAFFRSVPNLTIMAPKDFLELEDMLEFAINLNKPVVIRYPRGENASYPFLTHQKISLKKTEILSKGDDLSIVAIGKYVQKAMEIRDLLAKDNINVEVINVRFLKPLDKNTIIKSLNKTKKVITLEDGTILNGLASAIRELDIDNLKIKSFAYPDEFIPHGSVTELECKYGLDTKTIIKEIKEFFSTND